MDRSQRPSGCRACHRGRVAIHADPSARWRTADGESALAARPGSVSHTSFPPVLALLAADSISRDVMTPPRAPRWCVGAVTKAGIEPRWLEAGHDESGSQVDLLAIARCLPLRERGPAPWHSASATVPSECSVLMCSREMRAQAAIRSVLGCGRLQQLQTGCGRSDFRVECRRAPIPDVGQFFRRLSVVPRDLTFDGGGARRSASGSVTTFGQRLLQLTVNWDFRPRAATRRPAKRTTRGPREPLGTARKVTVP